MTRSLPSPSSGDEAARSAGVFAMLTLIVQVCSLALAVASLVATLAQLRQRRKTEQLSAETARRQLDEQAAFQQALERAYADEMAEGGPLPRMGRRRPAMGHVRQVPTPPPAAAPWRTRSTTPADLGAAAASRDAAHDDDPDPDDA